MTDEQIFDQVIRLERGERDGFLSEVCDEPGQRRRVEALLAAHEQSDSLLDTEALASLEDTKVDRPIRRTIGDFEILRELGRGGMGIVYEARQKSLRRKVALKILSSGLGLNSKAILRFRREAEAAGKLHHTNIVPIYTTGDDNGVHYYAMELIDGPSLDALVRSLRSNGDAGDAPTDSESQQAEIPDWVKETALFQGPGGEDGSATAKIRCNDSVDRSARSTISSGSAYFDEVATMVADVADALDHAHEHGVIHRDIKPSNLLLGPDGRLSINDFGLARMLEQPGMTMSGEFVGSPLYMSPEQITAGRVTVDHRTDIYSLGATLYELLVLLPPFPGQNRDQVLGQILHKDATSTRKLNRRVPMDLDTICMKAIDKDPDRRYQTAGALAEDLRRFVRRHAISARRMGPFGHSVRWVKRNPSWACLILLAMCSVAGLGLAYKNHLAQQRENLKSTQQLFLLYCVGGNLDMADTQMRQAKKLRASRDWILVASGQLELYRGNYDDALAFLRKAQEIGTPGLAARCMRAITHLFAGNEPRYDQEVRGIQEGIKQGDIRASEPGDNLYLAMAFQYSDPALSLDFLSKADPGFALEQLHDIVSCHAYTFAAQKEVDPNEALEYARKAKHSARSLNAIVSESPFALSISIWALTEAGICYRRSGQPHLEQEAYSEAKSLMQDKLGSRRYPFLGPYLLLDETSSQEEVSTHLRGLRDDQLNDYLRSYRMIDAIRDGNYEMSEVDLNQFERYRSSKWPFVILAELSANPSSERRKEIMREFRGRLERARNESTDGFAHIEFFWAVSRLLRMENETAYCQNQIRHHVGVNTRSYINRLMRPLVDLFDGRSPEEILAKAGDSRRSLTYAWFGLGIEALARGDRRLAKQYFDACATGGCNGFYVCQMCRALSEKLEHDPDWPRWIDGQESEEPR